MSRSELFREAGTDYIDAYKQDHVREVLDAVYGEQPSQFDRGLIRMQVMSLPRKTGSATVQHCSARNACDGDDSWRVIGFWGMA